MKILKFNFKQSLGGVFNIEKLNINGSGKKFMARFNFTKMEIIFNSSSDMVVV